MKSYQVWFDGEFDVVEASDFGNAIRIWRKKLIADNSPGDFEETQEPDQVVLMKDEPVLRDKVTP